MKEDAQLICPASYEDPNDIWAKLQLILLERLPLRDVTWKSPISSSYITIDKLPLRCLPSSANLFKDTDHAFRWFLAPYVNLYLLSAETLDSYKSCKLNIKKWVDLYNGAKKSPWLIIYIPSGSLTVDTYSKIYSKLCSDFYGDRTGDRSVMLIIPPPPRLDDSTASFGVRHGNNSATLNLIQQSNNSVADLLSKLREGIVVSFQHRSAMYDSDIRRLDSYRGTSQFDFRTLFLVKESLALMYQMMQLPDKALGQYEELEATLSYAPNGVLLESSDWPMVSSEPLKPTAVEGSATGSSGLEDSSPQKSSATKPVRAKDALSDACKNGDDVVAYSINLARMKILQKKMSMLELHRYVFARQMFFLLSHLERPVQCAEKALSFVQQSSAMIERRLEERYRQSIRQHEYALSSKAESATATEYAAASEVKTSLTNTCKLREKQATLWVLTASVKIIRVCRDLTAKILTRSAASEGDLKSVTSDVVSHAAGSEQGLKEDSSLLSSAAAAAIIRESSRVLGELMQFAIAKLQILVPGATGSGAFRKALSLALNSGCEVWGAIETERSFSAEFLTALEKELSQAGFDQDSLSSSAALPSDNNLLVSVALKIRASSTIWAVEFASQTTPVEPNTIVNAPILSSAPAVDLKEGHPLQNGSSASSTVLMTRQPSGGTVSASTPTLSSVHLSAMDKTCIQEVSLVAMMLKAQWELLQLAGRSRFVVATQLQCADLFMCYGMCGRATQLMESVVHSGLLVSPCNVPSSLLSAAALFNRSITVVEGPKEAHRLTASNRGGDWLEMRFWLLRKLLYCSKQTNDIVRFRLFASQLLHPDFLAAVDSCLSITSVDLLRLRKALHESVFTISSPQKSVSDLKLPLSAFFHMSILAAAPVSEISSSDSASLTSLTAIRGFEVVLDEIHPVTALQCTGGMAGYVVTLRLHSSLPAAFETDRMAVIYKRFRPDQVMNQSGTGNSLLSLPSTPLTASGFFRDREDSDAFPPSPYPSEQRVDHAEHFSDDTFSIHDDEFICEPLQGQILRIEPGVQFISLRFVPPAIGEYRLDRVLMGIGSLLFAEDMLATCGAHEEPCRFASIGGASLFPLPHSHAQLQAYFDEHFLIKVAAPNDLLRMQALTPTFSPLGQLDELSVQFETGASEFIRDLTVTAQHNPSTIAYDESSSAIQSPLSPLRQSLPGNESSFYEQQSLLTPNRRSSQQSQSSDDPMFPKINPTMPPGEVVVQVAESDKWRVVETVKRQSTEVGDSQWRSSSPNSLFFERVDASRSLRLVVPFTPSRTGIISALKSGQRGKLLEESASTTTVTVVLSGRMERNGCNIVFELTTNFRVSTGEALSVVVSDLTASASPSRSPLSVAGLVEERFVQTTVQNISPVNVRLLGYEVRGGALVVDGPLDLGGAGLQSKEEVVLAPRETYCAGFILTDVVGDLSDVTVDFSYGRVDVSSAVQIAPSTVVSAVEEVFHKKALLLTKDAHRDDALKASCARPIQQLSVRTTSIQSLPVVAVNEIHSFCYVIEFHLSGSSNSTVSTMDRDIWSFSDRETDNEVDSQSLVQISDGLLHNLSVTVCDTDGWLVAGRKRRVLSDIGLVRNLCSENVSSAIIRLSSFRFELDVLLVPVATGGLALPPLMVTYQCISSSVDIFAADSDDDDDETDKRRTSLEEVACLLYPNALLGPSVVSVLNPIDLIAKQCRNEDDLVYIEV